MIRLFAIITSIATALLGLTLVGPVHAADVVTTVTVGNFAQNVAISPDNTTAYVTNSDSNSVSVVSMQAGAVSATIPVGLDPQDVVMTADGSRVFVANRADNNVSVINAATNAVIGTVAVAGGPDGLSLSPDGSRLYVSASAAGRVVAISTATLAEVASVAVGNFPNSVAVTDDGAFAFTANRADSTVSVLALPALSVVATVPVGPDPFWVVTRGSGSGIRAYVTNLGLGANAVQEISLGAGGWSVSRTLLVPGRPIAAALSADGQTLYVTQFDGGAVAAVKLSNGAITGTTPIQPGLNGIAVSDDGSRAVAVRSLVANSTATIIALVPKVTLAEAQDVKGTTATGRATVTTDADGATDIRCIYSRQEADLADPYDSPASSMKGSPQTAAANGETNVTCDFEDLKRGRTYFYNVLATDSDGIGAATQAESFTTRPPKPDDLKVTRKKKRIVLRWDDVRTATYYKARIRKGGSYKNWRTLDNPKVVFKNLQRRTTYKMQIRAGNESGVGPKLTLKRKTR